MNNYTRRRFLSHSSVVGFGAAASMHSLGKLAYASSHGDYKALVCILLAGGIDSFNVLVPNDGRHADYAAFRSDLSLPLGDLLALDYTGAAGETYGLHPALDPVRTLFDQGSLAFVANVGTLADPTDKVSYQNGTVRLPLGLFSHSDQIAQWQTSVPDRRIATGVGGRMGDVIVASSGASAATLNVSTAGTNLFQTGGTVGSYAIDATDGVRTVAGYGDGGAEVFTTGLDTLLAAAYGEPFRRTYASRFRNAIDLGTDFKAALDAAPTLNTTFGAGPLSASLAQIARVISVRGSLGAHRQTFFVTVGGWDHHDDVIPLQAEMLPGIGAGLAEFHQAMTELGVADAVTTFTISDFGRTLTSNGKGSDHGWGGHQLVMGGAVRGRDVFGAYPSLVPDNALDVGRGRYIPTTSVDEYYAELALWFGIAPADLEIVLPNVRRFYSPESGVAPVGFIA